MVRLTSILSNAAAAIGVAALLVLSCGILADAASRSLLSAPIFGLSDFVELTAPVIVASCFPMALANRQHITIRFLGRALPARGGQTAELFGQMAALLVFAGLAWETGRYTAGLVEHNQFTWLLRIPVWPSWILATILITLCLPIQIGVLAEVIRALRAGQRLRSAEEELLHDAE